jgi:AcrR family transcriptional regulator
MRERFDVKSKQCEASPKVRGRPRAPETEEAIRQAVWSTLANVGYEGLTFEAVAEAARCSRATLYRRFSSKFKLVECVVDEALDSLVPANLENQSARQNLIAHATACAAMMRDERGRAMMSIGEAGTRNAELVALMLKHERGAKNYVYAEFRRLNTEGLSEEALSFAFDTLFGGVVFHVTLRSRALSAHEIAMLVDATIAIVLGHGAASTTSKRASGRAAPRT